MQFHNPTTESMCTPELHAFDVKNELWKLINVQCNWEPFPYGAGASSTVASMRHSPPPLPPSTTPSIYMTQSSVSASEIYYCNSGAASPNNANRTRRHWSPTVRHSRSEKHINLLFPRITNFKALFCSTLIIKQEDDILVRAVTKQMHTGTSRHNWQLVAQLLPRRSPEQCRARWKHRNAAVSPNE